MSDSNQCFVTCAENFHGVWTCYTGNRQFPGKSRLIPISCSLLHPKTSIGLKMKKAIIPYHLSIPFPTVINAPYYIKKNTAKRNYMIILFLILYMMNTTIKN